jgi:hypothetical protein
MHFEVDRRKTQAPFSPEPSCSRARTLWPCRINYTTSAVGLAIELTLVNKTATRLPEAIFFGFNPVGSGTGTWTMDKLGTPVNPLDVADGASKGLHCVTSGVQLAVGKATRVFGSPDVALARWDEPLPFPTPIHRQPDLSKGVAWVRCPPPYTPLSLHHRATTGMPPCCSPIPLPDFMLRVPMQNIYNNIWNTK